MSELAAEAGAAPDIAVPPDRAVEMVGALVPRRLLAEPLGHVIDVTRRAGRGHEAALGPARTMGVEMTVDYERKKQLWNRACGFHEKPADLTDEEAELWHRFVASIAAHPHQVPWPMGD